MITVDYDSKVVTASVGGVPLDLRPELVSELLRSLQHFDIGRSAIAEFQGVTRKVASDVPAAVDWARVERDWLKYFAPATAGVGGAGREMVAGDLDRVRRDILAYFSGD